MHENVLAARLRSLSLLALLGSTAFLACAGQQVEEGSSSDLAKVRSSGVGMDVNDLSFLFPLDESHAPIPSIGVDVAHGSDSVDILPQAVIEEIQAFQSGQVSGPTSLDAPRASWRIVGFRFDPCGPTIPGIPDLLAGFPTMQLTHLEEDLAKCDISIRLIAQPFVESQDVDGSVHIAYSFGVGNKVARDRLIAELRTLKSQSPADTSGVPLGVHPGLAANSSAAFAGQVKDFLVGELRHATLIAVSSMATTTDGAEWSFAAGQVSKGHWAAAPLTGFLEPTSAELVMSQSITIDRNVRPPAIPGVASFIATTTPLMGADVVADPEKLTHKINNPRINGLFNTDCVSCHSATERSIALKVPSSPERFATPKGVTGYSANPNSGNANFRNFGYFGGEPTVSHRTANETALKVDHVNRDLLGKQVGPGPICDDAKVWTCFRDQPAGGAAACLTPANGCVKPQ
jgi:hypothetical protein